MRANRRARQGRRPHARARSGDGPRRWSAEDAAVSDVIGAILLVGITVAMMVGLSAIMLNLDGPRDRVHMDVRMSVLPGANGWGTGDESVRIEHVGGESLDRAVARININIGGTLTQIRGDDLDQGFADGRFGLGDVWQRTQTILEGQTVEMLLIDEEGNAVTTSTKLTATGSGSSTGGGGGPSGNITYVASGTASVGTLTNFAGMQAEGDAAWATLQESSSGGVSTTADRDPSSVDNSFSVLNPNNVLTTNDQRATMSTVGSTIEVRGFTMPVSGVNIDRVYIGMEAQRGTGSGSGSTVQLTYEKTDTGPGPADISNRFTITSQGDTTVVKEITADHAPWDAAKIASLSVVAERIAGSRATLIDHLFVRVTYSTPVVTDAQATFGFSSVGGDCQDDHRMEVRYRTSIERFTLQVQGDDDVWRTKGTLNAGGFTQFTTLLGKAADVSGCEFRGGAPQVRLIDADHGAMAGSIQIDYMRIDTT